MVDRDMTFRDARPSDAADLARIGRETFVETFGHLYPPADLKTYLDETYSLEAMNEDLSNPDVEVRVAFTGRRITAYCKIGPTKLPIDTGHEPSLELHRVYVYEARQGVGGGRILLTWAMSEPASAERRICSLAFGKETSGRFPSMRPVVLRKSAPISSTLAKAGTTNT